MNFTEFVRNYHIQLNEQQMQAVQATEGPVLLLAVPGSGKTTVLVSRLGYMIYCLGITPESILTVTYTVAATNDMRRRFAGMFGEADAERLEFRTASPRRYCNILPTVPGKRLFRWQIRKPRRPSNSLFWK